MNSPISTTTPEVVVADIGAAIFESSPDCVKLLDTGGHILSMNRNGQCAMEIDDVAVVTGQPWTSLWPDAAREQVAAALQAAQAGGTGHFEAFCPTAKGTPKWWDVIVTPVTRPDGGIEKILSISRDITGMRDASEALRASAERLHLATDAAELGLWTWDARADTVCWENDRSYAIFGIDKESAPLSATGFIERLLHPDDGASFRRVLEAARGNGLRFQYQGRIVRGGELRWVEFFGRMETAAPGSAPRMVGTVADITTRKRAEEALFESRERLGKIISQAATGVLQADDLCRITLVNHKYCEMLGYTEAELMGRSLADMTAPSSLQLSTGALAVLAAGGPPQVIEKQYRRKDGSLLWATSSVSALRSQDGNFLGLVAIVVDITERKEAEEKLREADRRKDEFLAMLAHELRNPLSPIGAAAELLKLGKLDEARVRQTSEIISRQVGHMTNLVDDLLDVSRVTRGLVTLETAPLDMGAIVSDAVEQAGPLMRAKDHALSLQLAGAGALVLGDQKRLVQIVSNLLNNAAKYTPPGGQIVLRTELLDQRVVLSVTDNGIGIEPQLARRVFDLFTQAEHTPDRSSGGLGLGLALVKNLVELHGGTVACTSPGPGQGSTFSIALPRLAAAEPSCSALPAARGPGQGQERRRGLRTLVVDDNVDAAETLGMLLEVSGHHVTVEHSARRALAAVESGNFDACLLDIGLPEMDGNELARRLRAHPASANCLLIAITGYGQESDRSSTAAAGFDHHFVKPVDSQKLLSVMAQIR